MRALQIVVGWLLLVPLSRLVPKDRRLVVVIGRSAAGFSGNTKYMYLYAARHLKGTIEPVYITERETLRRALHAAGLRAVRHPSVYAAWVMLRARALLVEEIPWNTQFRYYLVFFARKVQLWHGVGMKKVHLHRDTTPRWSRTRISRLLLGTFARYDLMLFNSETQRRLRESAFSFREAVIMAHPRLDPLIAGRVDDDALIGADGAALQKLATARSQGKKVVLFAPTHRKGDREPVGDGAVEVERMKAFASENGLVFVVKYHPKTPTPGALVGGEGAELVLYDADLDVMPLLGLVDVMVTDYSSIYADFLVCQRPILFFPYDLVRYRDVERRLQRDYDEATPGRKCHTWQELEEGIKEVLDGHDPFALQRQRMLVGSFALADGRSAQRLWENIVKDLL